MNYIQHKSGVAGLSRRLGLEPKEKEYLAFVQEALFQNTGQLGEADKMIESERNKWANRGVAYNVQDILSRLFTEYTIYLMSFRTAKHSFENFSLEKRLENTRERVNIERKYFQDNYMRER